MISETGDIDSLLLAVLGQPISEVIERVTDEKRSAETLAKRSAGELRSQLFGYTQSCRCLKFWLTSKNKPRNCFYFEKFRPLTEALIEQRSLPSSMRDAFE